MVCWMNTLTQSLKITSQNLQIALFVKPTSSQLQTRLKCNKYSLLPSSAVYLCFSVVFLAFSVFLNKIKVKFGTKEITTITRYINQNNSKCTERWVDNWRYFILGGEGGGEGKNFPFWSVHAQDMQLHKV